MNLHYSERFEWSATANAVSLAIETRRRSGLGILDLTQSNPTSAGIVYPDGIQSALADAAVLDYHPEAAGMLGAREAVSAYYANSVDPSRILLTASTSEAYAYLFKLLCDPGDDVLAPRPSYPLFDMLAQSECVRLSQYPLHYHEGWFADIDQLQRAIGPRTRAVIIVNPNNPTGSYLKHSEYEAIAAICAARGIPIISDEVFADYEIEPAADAVRTLTGFDRCLSFSLSGLSKVSGMPQMKLGWIAASGPGHELAMQRLEWIADTFLSVSAPVQHAAPALLEARHMVQAQIRQRTLSNLNLLRSEASQRGLRVLRVEGGWCATLQVSRDISEEERVLQLIAKGVVVHPGFFFDFESNGFLVLSLLTESHIFRDGVRLILEKC